MKIALVFGMKMFKGQPLRQMIDVARAADQLNFDYVCLAEHVLMHGHPGMAAHSAGPVRHTPDELMPEPLITLAAFAGGLTCGFLWEFWNYWALAKWVYDLPFLGALQHVKYFEMPFPGLLGFIPFGVECWVMWQMIRMVLDGLAEPLPDEKCLL